MTVLTVLISMLLSWRERRLAAARPAAPPAKGRRPARPPGLLARGKVSLDRWVTAAAIAAILTIAVLGGLHWLRVFQR
ncbi:hypothetical protein [Roseomonas sp. KE2513]|uniref:hypothetical protein n=1 Tax=Roseomonas sp. KE2513 TaxID=2479202 RepID=UPI001E367F23|nr:hypothetical protein [Roseomonas sp. KE2513]